LLGFAFVLAGNTIESIFDLCEASDWIEREIHEEYSLEFTGREYEPLLLRQGDETGVNLRDGVTASGAAASSQEKNELQDSHGPYIRRSKSLTSSI